MAISGDFRGCNTIYCPTLPCGGGRLRPRPASHRWKPRPARLGGFPAPESRIPIPARGPPSAVLAVPLSLGLPAFGGPLSLPASCAGLLLLPFNPQSAIRNVFFTRNSFPRLGLQKRVSPGFPFPGLPASGGPARCSSGFPERRRVPAFAARHGCPQVSGRPFPVPRSPLLGVIHNGVCPSVHVKNRQIRVKIDQKGDVFRQKAIKKARISSCPS